MKTPGAAGVQADNSQLQKKEQGTNNRLAPYNPTHITAREAALNLLGLQVNDVLFDLGCGDGRLLFTAMERFYDDDYLMQEHQKIFNSAVTATHQPQQHHDNTEDVKEVTFDAGTRLSVDTQSQPSVPHMMCNASDDDDDEESHGASLNISKECNNLLPFALNVPQGSAPIMSPLHSHPMPTPTRSNRKSHQKNNSFPALHLSPIQSEAISEIQNTNIPLTITASSSGDEEIDQEGSEVLPNTTHNKTISDIPTICSSSLTLGLRCVGIEYDQALVEAAKERIDNSFKMFETFDDGWLKKRLCIRWGCVFDEWNVPDLQSNNAVDGTTEQFAQHLSLLEHATAVFVYLLPEGLKKVKPLLQEAARRRKEQMQSDNNTIDHHQQQHEEQLLQQTHRKDYSHVSDITDYDFIRVAHGSDVATDQKTTPSLPPFRVVSYMFSISGWTPTKVDRSSKGACPLYLYESHSILDSQE